MASNAAPYVEKLCKERCPIQQIPRCGCRPCNPFSSCRIGCSIIDGKQVKVIGTLLPGGGATLRTLTSLGGGV